MDVEVKNNVIPDKDDYFKFKQKQFKKDLNFEAPCHGSPVPGVTIHQCKATFAVKLKQHEINTDPNCDIVH
jgi:hypothetical protein